MRESKRAAAANLPAFWRAASVQMNWLKAAKNQTYRGHRLRKLPTDLWVYQGLIERLRPGLIIELGTWHGGSALWFAHQLDVIGGDPARRGIVLSIDVDPQPDLPRHPRIEYQAADALDSYTTNRVENWVRCCTGPVMVIEDSRHIFTHVHRVLDAYSRFVTVGSYFVVEDTKTEGVKRAVDRFLKNCGGKFVADRQCEGWQVTTNKGGWLRRVK